MLFRWYADGKLQGLIEKPSGITCDLAEPRTLVAVPVLLMTTPDAIETQIERLEIHHLARPEGDLHFVLLSDWTDAATGRATYRRPPHSRRSPTDLVWDF
jgi:hypothetical protein